jgi:hypothetical protein
MPEPESLVSYREFERTRSRVDEIEKWRHEIIAILTRMEATFAALRDEVQNAREDNETTRKWLMGIFATLLGGLLMLFVQSVFK